MEAAGKEGLKVQRGEIEDARWFNPEEALKTVEYKGADKLLEKALEVYKTEKRCSE